MKKNELFLGAIIGGAVTAVAALLLAPKSGDKLREDLGNQADDFKDKVQAISDKTLESLKKQTNDLSNRVKKTTQDIEEEKDELDNLSDDIIIEGNDVQKMVTEDAVEVEETTHLFENN
ncbi:hypothetical protein IGJ02_000152 [Enterococcus sp. DIV0724b]|uniref:YtxH domain-containing protein n=1 Tax=Enterococcus sp. DIV0724b TaxID=2774694 RepID=UPI003D2FD4B7